MRVLCSIPNFESVGSNFAQITSPKCGRPVAEAAPKVVSFHCIAAALTATSEAPRPQGSLSCRKGVERQQG
ncbi:hypothetical protein WJX73_008468 [Symbiochloris irregularis]|uniref:Uncharacterized protein n=1 Tax=Symbiochloris irregularis TaxID=706552 RepID=A0AAW1PIR8_9CHLO